MQLSVAVFVLWVEGLAFLPVYPSLPLFSLTYQLDYKDLLSGGWKYKWELWDVSQAPNNHIEIKLLLPAYLDRTCQVVEKGFGALVVCQTYNEA